MKYLVVVFVVAITLWLLLRGRKTTRPDARPAAGAGEAQAMVQCSHCGVHLPRADCIEDQRGAYCSEAHQLKGPRRS